MTILGPQGQTIRLDRRSPLRAPLERPRLPRKIGSGAAVFAATTVLDRQPFAWDTNRFYARLGLHSGCTRLEMVAAYHRLGGSGDHLLTYAFKLLLNKVQRARYDAMPLGTFWADDPALSTAVADGDCEPVSAEVEWSYYLDSDVPAPIEWPLSAWQAVVSQAIVSSGLKHVSLALGITALNPRLDVVGFNIVLFVVVDDPPREDYARQIAQELRVIADHAERI